MTFPFGCALLANYAGMPKEILHGALGRPPATMKEVMPELSAVWLTDAPQTRYRSSETGYMALGCAMEASARRPFAEAVRERLLAPLGMNSSSFAEPPGAGGRLAAPHLRGKPIPAANPRAVPAKGFFTTANDLARFMRMLLNHGEIDGRAILAPETVESMFRRQFPEARWPFAEAAGFSWKLRPFPGGGDVALLQGIFPGYASYAAVLPRQRLGVIVLANDGSAGRFEEKLADMALKLAVEAKTGVVPAERAARPAEARTVEVEPAILERYAGGYGVFPEMTKVVRDGSKLSVNFQGRDFDLMPAANDTLIPRARVALGLITVPIDGYRVRMAAVDGRLIAVLEGMPDLMLFEKAEGAVPEAWRRRSGAWHVVNGDEGLRIRSVRLQIESEVLALQATVAGADSGYKEMPVTMPLRPINDTLAVTTENGLGGGDSVEAITRDGRQMLLFSGYVLERQAEEPR